MREAVRAYRVGDMANIYTGRKVYRTRDMTQAAFDAGENVQGVVTEIRDGWARVEWADGTVTWDSIDYPRVYAPSA